MNGSTPARDWLHSWNPPTAKSAATGEATGRLAAVRVEDDVREVLQNVRTARPSLQQRRQMLRLSALAGVDVSFLGFPAASTPEQAQCRDLVAYIGEQHLPLTPVLMARAAAADVHAVLSIQQQTGVTVTVDLYLSSSPIRAKVEGWDLDAMLTRLTRVARLATLEGLAFRIAFEDSTRTPPGDLTVCVRAALDAGAGCIVLNDTVGDCLPAGAHAHVRFVRDLIERSRAEAVVAWHGHNDKGLALANSLAATEAGAELISGTFTGLGERSGNLALEQFLLIAAAAGNRRVDISHLVAACELTAAATRTQIPHRQPIVGADAFTTATGTHAGALVKARALGSDFEDLVYSAVSAAAIGRRQNLVISANSGRAGVKAVLDDLGCPSDPATIQAVLSYCRQHNRTLSSAAQVREALPAAPPPPHADTRPPVAETVDVGDVDRERNGVR